MTEPVFTATSAGADAVVRRGNLRRLRSGAAAGSVVGLVVGVALVAPWQGPGARDSLVPVDEPTARPTPSVQALPRVSHHPLPGTAPSGSAVPLPGTRPTGSVVDPAPSPPAGGPAATPSYAARRTSPITRGTATIAADDLCSDGTTPPSGWCLRYTGPSTARRGVPVTLSAELCRISSFGAASVTFSDTREVRLELDRTGWSAGQGERYTQPGRTVTVDAGHCLTWASTWDTRGADGFLVLPGDYDVYLGIEGDIGLGTSSNGALHVTD